MIDADYAQSLIEEQIEAVKKGIREILDRHEPFHSWKAVSRALDEIIDLVGWVYPDERDTNKAKSNGHQRASVPDRYIKGCHNCKHQRKESCIERNNISYHCWESDGTLEDMEAKLAEKRKSEKLSNSIKTAFEDYNHFKINTLDNLRETILKIVELSSGDTARAA